MPTLQRNALRRRRIAVGLIAAISLGAGIVVGSDDADDAVPIPDPLGSPPAETEAEPPGCPAEIASRPRRLAGQMLVARMEASATEDLRGLLRDGEIGGVILFPPDGIDPGAVGDQVAALRRTAVGAAVPAPLVAIDQEGGEVERLPSLAPDRSPAAIALDGERAARAEGLATGRALNGLGIDVDLAPVLDVPAVDGAFIASRAYSSDPSAVAALGTAFGAALQERGVAATAKHFPGLGLATENTDLAPSTIDATEAELKAGLEPFRAAIDAGFELVMVSNATYPAFDPKLPASQSRRVIEGLLRRRLGYRGVVITDDLGAGALAGAGLDEGEAAVGAASAGADLLLVALTDATVAREALVQAIRSGELDRDASIASCERTTALRERLAAQAAIPRAGR